MAEIAGKFWTVQELHRFPGDKRRITRRSRWLSNSSKYETRVNAQAQRDMLIGYGIPPSEVRIVRWLGEVD